MKDGSDTSDIPTRTRLVAVDMLKIYGEGAGHEAAKRAEDAKARQQPEAENMWTEVRSAIDRLKSEWL